MKAMIPFCLALALLTACNDRQERDENAVAGDMHADATAPGANAASSAGSPIETTDPTMTGGAAPVTAGDATHAAAMPPSQGSAAMPTSDPATRGDGTREQGSDRQDTEATDAANPPRQ